MSVAVTLYRLNRWVLSQRSICDNLWHDLDKRLQQRSNRSLATGQGYATVSSQQSHCSSKPSQIQRRSLCFHSTPVSSLEDTNHYQCWQTSWLCCWHSTGYRVDSWRGLWSWCISLATIYWYEILVHNWRWGVWIAWVTLGCIAGSLLRQQTVQCEWPQIVMGRNNHPSECKLGLGTE